MKSPVVPRHFEIDVGLDVVHEIAAVEQVPQIVARPARHRGPERPVPFVRSPHLVALEIVLESDGVGSDLAQIIPDQADDAVADDGAQAGRRGVTLVTQNIWVSRPLMPVLKFWKVIVPLKQSG